MKLHTFDSGHTFKLFIQINCICDDLQIVVVATVVTFYGILTSCTPGKHLLYYPSLTV